MLKRMKGFTLIELLIVVAIIAILAAIAVPNFLEAQTRSKVSRVKSDLRSLATGIESYYIDSNSYPAQDSADGAANPATTLSYNAWIDGATDELAQMPTFMCKGSGDPDEFAVMMLTMTTPISYITSYFRDPFADTKNATFMYSVSNDVYQSGWVLWSYGPDTDEKLFGDIVVESAPASDSILFDAQGANSVMYVSATYYNPNETMPSPELVNVTYDPSNGTTSNGDVWRLKQ